jgi:hypothetical protein
VDRIAVCDAEVCSRPIKYTVGAITAPNIAIPKIYKKIVFSFCK